MLSDRGFKNVINMAGGIKAWNSNTAIGPEDTGIHLFSGTETLAEMLLVAYSMEKALHDFYTAMADTVAEAETRELFSQLAAIEVKHQQRIFTEYQQESGTDKSREEIDRELKSDTLEGGLTTEQYLDLYQVDTEVPVEVVSLAMAIEAQALDLYQRTADRAETDAIRSSMARIADEERAHLRRLGTLLD